MKNKKIVFLSIAIVLILACIFILVSFQEPQKEEKIKIGFIGPLSGEAAYGQFFLEPIMLALDEIKKEEGVEYELIVEDAQCDASKAITAFTKLAEIDKVKYIFGGVCSTEARAINPLLEKYRVISISASSLAVVAKESKNQFTVEPTTDIYIEAILNYLANDGKRNMGIIYANTEYGIETMKSAEELAPKYGIDIVIKEPYSFGSRDFKTQLIKIKAKNPEAIIIIPQAFNAPPIIVKQIKELGINATLFTEETGCAALMSTKQQWGVYCASALAGFDLNRSKYKEFEAKFKEKFGKEPVFTLYQAAAYDAMLFLHEAIKENKDPEAVREYLLTHSFKGASGSIKFDRYGINRGMALGDIKIMKI